MEKRSSSAIKARRTNLCRRKDFGDFVIWRHDDVPAYQLAVVVDDAAMHITEVVRGADLLLSTARQIVLYRALGLPVPQFSLPASTDEQGSRLAKRHDALSLRTLRAQAGPGRHPRASRVQAVLISRRGSRGVGGDLFPISNLASWSRNNSQRVIQVTMKSARDHRVSQRKLKT
jgi:glutamyl/glutaminyl-tRNA synthetase